MKSINLTSSEKIAVFFTGPFALIGFIITIVGFILVSVMDIPTIESALFEVISPKKTKGVVVKTGETITTINNHRVLFVDYEFTVANEKHTGRITTTKRLYKRNDEVNIEYLPNFFMVSQIEGTETDISSYVIFLFLIVLPGIGIFILSREFKRVNRVIHILSRFKLSKAILKERVSTSTRVNNRHVYRMTYNYNSEDRIYKSTFKTLKPNHFMEEELLAYAERNPSKSVILKRLPDSVAKRMVALV